MIGQSRSVIASFGLALMLPSALAGAQSPQAQPPSAALDQPGAAAPAALPARAMVVPAPPQANARGTAPTTGPESRRVMMYLLLRSVSERNPSALLR